MAVVYVETSMGDHMWEDPIVAEIHRIRAEMMAEFDGDLNKLMDYLQKREQEHPERLITPEELRRMRKRSEEELRCKR